MQYLFSKPIDALKPSAIREILKHLSNPSIIPFASGSPAMDAIPLALLTSLANQVLGEEGVNAFQYAQTEGYPPLREVLCSFIKTRYGIGTEQDDILITSGAQQAIELCARTLCDRGDVVFCEDPSFIGGLGTFRAAGARLVGIPMESDGISTAALEQAIRKNPGAKALYTIPNFHNPTGITMSLAKRREVYRLAKENNIVIIEDDPYRELRFSGEELPCIKSMDTDGVVVYAGSFSKILSPGMRVGFGLIPKGIFPKVVATKQMTDVHTNILAQMICHRFLTQTDFDAHVAHLRSLYGKKARLMEEAARAFPADVTFTKPEGGMFLWGTLPKGGDGAAFARRAIEEAQVAIVPGAAFYVDDSAVLPTFRLNYSAPGEEQIQTGIKRLAALLTAR